MPDWYKITTYTFGDTHVVAEVDLSQLRKMAHGSTTNATRKATRGPLRCRFETEKEAKRRRGATSRPSRPTASA
jgi:hypothetical protein